MARIRVVGVGGAADWACPEPELIRQMISARPEARAAFILSSSIVVPMATRTGSSVAPLAPSTRSGCSLAAPSALTCLGAEDRGGRADRLESTRIVPNHRT